MYIRYSLGCPLKDSWSAIAVTQIQKRREKERTKERKKLKAHDRRDADQPPRADLWAKNIKR